MKKVALSLMTFALVGAMAFADDAAPVTKISGYLDTGVLMTNSSANGTQFQAMGKDSGQSVRAKVTAAQTGANYGVSVTIEDNVNAAHSFTLDSATAWVSPLAGFKLSGGTDYTGSINGVDDIGAGFGATGVVAAEYTTNGFTGAFILQAPTSAGGAPVGFGARYVMDKVATVNVQGALNSAQKFTGYDISASLAAVDKLTLTVGLFSNNLAVKAATKADLNVAYAVTDALTVGALSYYNVADSDVLVKSGDFWTRPNVSYKLDPKVTLSAQVQYDSTANANIEPQAQVSFALPNTTLNVIGRYDTNSTHAATAAGLTSAWVELLYTF